MAREVGPDVSITPDSVCDCGKSGYVSWPLSAGGMSPLCVYVKEREREGEGEGRRLLFSLQGMAHATSTSPPPLSLSLLFFLSSSSFYTFTFFSVCCRRYLLCTHTLREKERRTKRETGLSLHCRLTREDGTRSRFKASYKRFIPGCLYTERRVYCPPRTFTYILVYITSRNIYISSYAIIGWEMYVIMDFSIACNQCVYVYRRKGR